MPCYIILLQRSTFESVDQGRLLLCHHIHILINQAVLIPVTYIVMQILLREHCHHKGILTDPEQHYKIEDLSDILSFYGFVYNYIDIQVYITSSARVESISYEDL